MCDYDNMDFATIEDQYAVKITPLCDWQYQEQLRDTLAMERTKAEKIIKEKVNKAISLIKYESMEAYKPLIELQWQLLHLGFDIFQDIEKESSHDTRANEAGSPVVLPGDNGSL